MVMWKYEGEPDKFKPKLRIKPKDSRSAFISLAGGDPKNRVIYRGRFLDLSVLGWALRHRHMPLAGFLHSFSLEGKIDHEPTGHVTKKELRYGRRDTECTVALLNAMKREYDGFPIDLSPERALSAASITKAFLDEMGIEQPSRKFELRDEILGKCMQAYYGGRSEIRIRHQEVPVVVCDTTSQTLSSVIWRHYLHPEDKSLAPDGEPCDAYTRGLLMRRPIEAMTPLVFIGKEIERRAQEGEDVSLLENTGPIKYQRHQTAKTRAADAGLILRARRFPLRKLMRESGASQHAIERFLRGDRVHPSTRAALARAVQKLEREGLQAT